MIQPQQDPSVTDAGPSPHRKVLRPALPALLIALFPVFAVAAERMTVHWNKNILTIRGAGIPGDRIEINYLEAFCRSGSTDRDWSKTTIPHKTKLLHADPDGHALRLATTVEGGIEIEHRITAGEDDVTFDLKLEHKGEKFIDADWAQPCMRVGDFTGRGQDDYFEKCFLFTDKGLVRMHQTHRETKARYVPGQVYVPAGVNRNDVNPRPLSKTIPVNGLVGCVSADESKILAMAWDHTQELFQGVIVCVHNDFRIGGMHPGQTKHRRGKIYFLPNNPPALLKRYQRDFPNGR
jgi:hypothetical protein